MKNDFDFSVIKLQIAKKVLLETSFDDFKKEKQPLAIILGGQRASGKLNFLDIYRIIFIAIKKLFT